MTTLVVGGCSGDVATVDDSKHEELFQVFDENEQPLAGLVPRSVVHRDGHLHRSVNVLLFNSQRQLLLQRRMPTKDVCPNLWDISCAEHLKPGESYKDAAIRGLHEELNIDLQQHPEALASLSRLLPSALYRHEDPAKGIKDNEFREAWQLQYDGAWQVDLDEVAEAKFVSLDQVRHIMQHEPESLTPWGRHDIAAMLNTCER